MKDYILVIDSGLGGLSILKSLKKALPFENFIYVLDNNNSPYGNKTKDFLVQNVKKIILNNMKKYIIKLIVFACNTLTSVAIEQVREFLMKQHLKNLICKKNGIKTKTLKINFNIKIVGTEPPIKMVNKNEETLIIATKQTIKYNKILNENFDNENFMFVALNDIAKMLDNNFYDRREIIQSLKNQIPNKNYKNVVLGCTHYYFLEENIKQALNNPNLKFYNSIKGVESRVKNLLGCASKINKNINKNKKNKQRIKIVLTKRNFKLKNTARSLLKN